jgi:hypothetical protein
LGQDQSRQYTDADGLAPNGTGIFFGLIISAKFLHLLSIEKKKQKEKKKKLARTQSSMD